MREMQNTFTQYELTEAETAEGSVLTPLQRAVIQNMLAATVEEKLLLPFTPNDIASYQQREAELQGELRTLKTILALSTEAEEVIATRNMNPND